MKSHKTVLKNLMPKSGEYPVILREAKSILLEEQPNLISIYRGASTVKNFVYGMKSYGLSGHPDMMVLTDDLNSSNPAVTKPKNPDFSFEIKPKDFKLGLTGRLLENEKGQKHNEFLFVGLDIYDAFDFAKSISPKRVFALTEDDKEILIYERDKYNVGKTEELDIQRKKRHFVMSENRKKDWMCDTELLPTGELKVVTSDFYEAIKKYERAAMLFGHKFENIDEFFSSVTLTDNHLIWKICKSDRRPNTPLIDAEPYYGEYQGKPRYENINRLHFMPDKAGLWFDGTMISFDKTVGINALMNLGDIVKDVWFSPGARKCNEGWDIVLDKSRGITPEKPVEVYGSVDYQKYPVLKNKPEFPCLK